jgi:uncharacterized YigZ family protein
MIILKAVKHERQAIGRTGSMRPAPDRMSYTIRTPGESLYKEQASKFYGYAAPAADRAAVEAVLRAQQEQHAGAQHHCYAYRLAEQAYASDAGEPRGSAGPPILRRLQSYDLVHVVCVVVRYFGGTKLGIGGLIRAYGAAAEAALAEAEQVPWVPQAWLQIEFAYPQTAPIEQLLHQYRAEKAAATYGAACQLQVQVAASQAQTLAAQLGPYVADLQWL